MSNEEKLSEREESALACIQALIECVLDRGYCKQDQLRIIRELIAAFEEFS